jgi:hypothetical protein
MLNLMNPSQATRFDALEREAVLSNEHRLSLWLNNGVGEVHD